MTSSENVTKGSPFLSLFHRKKKVNGTKSHDDIKAALTQSSGQVCVLIYKISDSRPCGNALRMRDYIPTITQAKRCAHACKHKRACEKSPVFTSIKISLVHVLCVFLLCDLHRLKHSNAVDVLRHSDSTLLMRGYWLTYSILRNERLLFDILQLLDK
uniref:Apple domain-containing protein n=1 Tax=Heterorhabditis bacteriophora TaxID=37862 RepID=A0A1I7XFF7_HETBA